jgi:hypothetical protein
LRRATHRRLVKEQDREEASVLSLLQKGLRKTEQQIEQLLDRIVESSTASVIAAHERRIAGLEREKLVIIEKLQANAFPKRGSAQQFELAFRFLENPHELWASECLDDKRLVLKLTFADRLAYCRNGGFRTPQTTLPFKALEAVQVGKCKVAERVSAIVDPKMLYANGNLERLPICPSICPSRRCH